MPTDIVRRTRHARIAGVLLALLSASPALAQSPGNYVVQRLTGQAYTSIAGTGAAVTGWRNGANTDNNRSTDQLIGFNFRYIGNVYRTFSVSTNGFIDFSSSDATGFADAFGSNNGRFSFTVAPTDLAIAPMYDDLFIPAGTLAQAVKTEVTGVQGSRVLTVEWIGLRCVGASSGSLNFQVKLFEATGAIQINYGPMSNSGVTPSYTCGINEEGVPGVAPEALVQQTANTATFSGVAQNALATLPAASSRLNFTGVETTQPAPPIGLAISNIGQTTATVGFLDNSNSETYYDVFRSTNGTSFTYVGTVPSFDSNGVGNDSFFGLTGLQPETHYWVRVTAENEVAPPSTPAEIQFDTAPRGVYSVATGNWNAGATWSTGVVPTASDTVTIRDGHTVTLNINTTVRRLNVGQGVSGVLRYDATLARSLAVEQDVTVRAGALLATAASGTATNQALTVSGSCHVAGSLDFSTNANTAGGTVTFAGGDCALDGAGAVDLRRLAVFLDDTTDVLTVSVATLEWMGSNTAPSPVVDLTRGVLHLTGTEPFNGPLLATNATPSAGGLWIDNPNVTITPHPSGGFDNRRLLRLTQGTFMVGDAVNENLRVFAGARLVVDGGLMLVAGAVAPNGTDSWRFEQQGGMVEVSREGHTSFDGLSVGPNGIASLGGGEVKIVRGGTGTAGHDWDVDSVETVGEHTVWFGDAPVGKQRYRATGQISRVQAPDVGFANFLQLDQVTAYRGVFAAAADSVHIGNGLTRVLGDDFSAAGVVTTSGTARLLLGGGYGGAPLGTSGVAPKDLVIGTVAGPLLSLYVDEPNGVALDVGVGGPLVTRNLFLLDGVLTHGGDLNVGVAAQVCTVVVEHGALASGYAGVATAQYDLAYRGYALERTAGPEVPPLRTLRRLLVQSPVTLAGGPLSVGTEVVLEAPIATAPSHELSVPHSVTFTPVPGAPGPSPGHVDGPMIVRFSPSSPTALKWYPLGHDSVAYRPLGIEGVNTSGALRPCTLEVIRPGGPAAVTPPVGFVAQATAYRLSHAGTPLNAGTRLRVSFQSDDAPWSVGGAMLTGAATLVGPFGSLGGVRTGNSQAGTIGSTLDLVPTHRFFRIGETTPAVRVVSPDGPDVLALGQVTTIAIQTLASAAIVRVDLFVSREGADGPWEPIGSALPDSTHYHWVPTGPPSADVFFRAVVKDTLQRTSEDVSDEALSIQTIGPVSVDDDGLPVALALAPRPNPASGDVRLELAMPAAGRATVVVHDAAGREVARLHDGPLDAGRHALTWRSADPPGLYFVRFATDRGGVTRRVVRLQ